MTESNRWLKQVEKYGSEEAARAEMRRRAEKSKRNTGGKGGFAALSKEELIAISSKGGKASKK